MPFIFHQHTLLVVAIGWLFATLAKLKSSRVTETTAEQLRPRRRVILITMLMSLLFAGNQILLLYTSSDAITHAHVGGTRGGKQYEGERGDTVYERHFILPQAQDQAAAQATSSSDRRPPQTDIVQPHIGYKKVLVTGGAGFVGSSVAAALLARGDDVVIVDEMNDYYDVRIKEDNLQRLREMFPGENRLAIYRGDICDENLMLQLFEKEQPHWVCHMAARAGVRPSIQDPFVYIHSNIRGTTHLMELSHKFGVKNFVFASSSSVYGGSNKNTFFSEEDNVDNPISPYAASKKAVELLAYTYHHLYQLNMTGLRLFTVYGPRGRPDMAPFKFIDHVSRGLELQQFGDGSSSRDYTYIDDIVDGVVRSIDRPYKYEIINLGKGSGTSLKEFLHIASKYVGKRPIIKIMPDQPGDVPYTRADVSKANELLGYKATVSFDEGMRRTVDWYVNEYRKNGFTETETQATQAILPHYDDKRSRGGIGSIGDLQKHEEYAESHAIFLISFGQKAAESTLVERCILSLRRRGQWKGYIVLLTDAAPSRYENVWNEEKISRAHFCLFSFMSSKQQQLAKYMITLSPAIAVVHSVNNDTFNWALQLKQVAKSPCVA